MSEEKADGSGYEKLDKNKDESYRRSRAGTFGDLCLPEDKYNLVYLSFVFGGIGFLIPYNSFIMASDYFKNRFPGSPVVFDMSLVYIVTALVTVLGNNLLVDIFSMDCRIHFGYVVSFCTLTTVVLFQMYMDLAIKFLSSYTANLVAVAIVAIGCTIQQSSFYGYTGMLPPKYIHAVMVGESKNLCRDLQVVWTQLAFSTQNLYPLSGVAGFLTSLTRITTRFFIRDLRFSTITFFIISMVFLGVSCILFPLIRKSDFVQFYLCICERDKTKIILEPREDDGLIEVCDSRYGVLKMQTSPPASSNILSFANPVYEPTDQGTRPTYKVEDVLFTRRSTSQTNTMGLSAIKEALRVRWTVIRHIYPYMASIFLVYFTTLYVYPGVTSEIESCHMDYWMPMLMMIDFNCADVIGKMVTSTYTWSGPRLLKCSIARLIMIPLMVLCVMPFWHLGLYSYDLFAFTYSIVLGLSNGFLGSLPMIQAPSKVPRCYRELAGNMMTLFYMWGLATGSLGAYSLEKIIRPMKAQHHCDYNKYQRHDTYKSYIPHNSTGEFTTLSSTPSTFITTILSSLATTNYTESI